MIIFSIVFGAAIFTACDGGTQSGGQEQDLPKTYTLSQTALTLERGDSYQLTVSPSPMGETLLWETSNANVATVSMGEIYAKSVGEATVTMKVGDAEYTCDVTVIDLIVKNATITLPRYTANVPVGTVETFEADLIVNDEIETETVTWSVVGSADGVIDADDYTVDGNKISLRYDTVGTVTVTASYGETVAVYTVYVAPQTREKLSVPTALTVENETVSWTAVPNATKYGVKIKDHAEETVTGTSFINGEILRNDGEYEISVRAIADPSSAYIDGEYSKAVKVKCQFMMLYEDTTSANVDYIKFTPANGEVESYALYVNGEEQAAVRANEEIPVAEYGEATLCVVAKMVSGATQKTREIQRVNDSQTSAVSVYGGKTYPSVETENLPVGASASALKLSVFPSGDSSYQTSVHNADFESVKVGTVVSYRVYVTDITTNLFENITDWENGKQEATEVPLNRLVRLSGVRGNTPSVPGVRGNIQKDTWYTVYSTASVRADSGKIEFSSYLAAWKSKTERHYAYTMYIDRICVGVKLESASDTENTVAKGTFGFDGLSITVEKETANVYGSDSLAALKITTSAGPYKTSSGYLTSQVLFGELEANDVVSYYIKAQSVQTSSTKDGTYANATKLKMSELVNPSGFGGLPIEITTSTGAAVTGDLNVGEWYKVSYVTTGVANDKNNTTFKYCAFKSGRMNMFQYCTTAFMKAEFIIDGISVTKGVDDMEKTVLFGVIGIDNLSMSVAKETENVYGESLAAIKFSTEAGIYKTCSGTMTSAALFGTLKAGDTISYYIQAASVQTSQTQAVANRTYTAATTILSKELLNPEAWGAIPTSLTKADGTAVASGAITGEEVLTVGEWYKVTYKATGVQNDTNNTTFKRIGFNSGKACFMQYCTTAFMKAEFVLDGITVTNA